MDYGKIKGRELIQNAKRQEKGGIIERLDKKAQASYFKITSEELAKAMELYLSKGQ